jgi:hypothetical protein
VYEKVHKQSGKIKNALENKGHRATTRTINSSKTIPVKEAYLFPKIKHVHT